MCFFLKIVILLAATPFAATLAAQPTLEHEYPFEAYRYQISGSEASVCLQQPEVAKAGNTAPDLFHAWNTAKKAGRTLDLNQLKKLGEDITNTPGLAKAFGENPNLVKSWKLLENSPYRKNARVLLVFLDENILLTREFIMNNTTIRQNYPDIAIEELTAIRHYSQEPFDETFNVALANGTATEKMKGFKELLNNGLDKLPNHTADPYTWRGIGEDEINAVASHLKKDDVHIFNEFKSSSISDATALTYSEGYMYQFIPPTAGKNITGISTFGTEGEVQFRTGLKWKVLDVVPNFRPSGPIAMDVTLIKFDLVN